MKVIKTIKDKILFAYQLVAAITLVVLIAAAAIQVVTRYYSTAARMDGRIGPFCLRVVQRPGRRGCPG